MRVAAQITWGLLLFVSRAEAQFGSRSTRASDIGGLLAVNALIGGATAAVRAAIGRREVATAFAKGTVGGGVHFGGKLLATQTRAFRFAAIPVGATGASMVSNAGLGQRLLEEVHVPVGFLHVSYRPYSGPRVRLALDAVDAAVTVDAARREGVRLDVDRSLVAGTLVFTTVGRDIKVGDRFAGGVAPAGIIVLSAYAGEPHVTLGHEMVHVLQHAYSHQAFDRPMEVRLRKTRLGARMLPSWLEIGLTSGALYATDWLLFGDRVGLSGMREHEADRLEKR
jgi:hypothetical protein